MPETAARARPHATPTRLPPLPTNRAHAQATLAPATPTATTPACAGSIGLACPSARPSWGHPRVRGEHSAHSHDVEPGAGVIPACAGSIMPRTTPCGAWWGHPRVRGEQTPGMPRPYFALGSSPRTRGAGARGVPELEADGVIPACAGSRRPAGDAAASRRGHPRVRGEQPTGNASSLGLSGSSPRARGAEGRLGGPVRAQGVIPACAGSSPSRRPRGWCGRGHPRVRGEQSCAPFRQRPAAGSSPRARGAWLAGLIGRSGMPGSSPRARGASPSPAARAPSAGVIPACAGSRRAEQRVYRRWCVFLCTCADSGIAGDPLVSGAGGRV